VRDLAAMPLQRPESPLKQAFADAARALHGQPLCASRATQFFLLPFIFCPRHRLPPPARRPSRLVVSLYGLIHINEIEKSRKDLEKFAPHNLNKPVFQFALFHLERSAGLRLYQPATTKNPGSHHARDG